MVLSVIMTIAVRNFPFRHMKYEIAGLLPSATHEQLYDLRMYSVCKLDIWLR